MEDFRERLFAKKFKLSRKRNFVKNEEKKLFSTLLRKIEIYGYVEQKKLLNASPPASSSSSEPSHLPKMPSGPAAGDLRSNAVNQVHGFPNFYGRKIQ